MEGGWTRQFTKDILSHYWHYISWQVTCLCAIITTISLFWTSSSKQRAYLIICHIAYHITDFYHSCLQKLSYKSLQVGMVWVYAHGKRIYLQTPNKNAKNSPPICCRMYFNEMWWDLEGNHQKQGYIHPSFAPTATILREGPKDNYVDFGFKGVILVPTTPQSPISCINHPRNPLKLSILGWIWWPWAWECGDGMPGSPWGKGMGPRSKTHHGDKLHVTGVGVGTWLFKILGV